MTRPSPAWTEARVGDCTGKTVVITGANSGIGRQTAKILADRGATVVLACRNAAAAEQTAGLIGGSVVTRSLDLASLESIGHAAQWVRNTFPRVDLLINNAGVMMTPQSTTVDGFERQIGTNHLGHFAFTGLLLDRLVDVPGSRILTVSSSAHRQATLDLADLHFQRRRYRPIAAYAQSKLANLLFSQELDSRLNAAGAHTISLALEPGFTPTGLTRHTSAAIRVAVMAMTRLFGQPDVNAGARVVLRAAADPDVARGDYYAPDGRPPMRPSGDPVRIAAPTTNADLRRQLWEESERSTGVYYPLQ